MARVMVVLGTRPEAIKLIPVIFALNDQGLRVQVCVTAQHRELLDQALSCAGIVPDLDLDLMRPDQGLALLTAHMLTGLDALFAQERPTRVVVQGDTATAAAAAQAAFLRRIPVAHVEAGLRTGNLHQPWPEEGNRRAISTWADIHFAPTMRAARALRDEGVPDEGIFVTGNPIVDALQSTLARKSLPDPAVRDLLDRCAERRLILVTCHRRENLGGGVQGVASAIRMLASRGDLFLITAAHPNPHVGGPLKQDLAGLENVAVIPPLAFEPFLQLLQASYLAITDSGGVQEEAPALGVPLLVARNVTERPEGIDAGTALLVGTDTERIVRETVRILDSPLVHARMARVHQPYGDGRAAERIAAIIAGAEGMAPPLLTVSAE